MKLKIDQSGLDVVAKNGQQRANSAISKTQNFMGIRPTGILGLILF